MRLLKAVAWVVGIAVAPVLVACLPCVIVFVLGLRVVQWCYETIKEMKLFDKGEQVRFGEQDLHRATRTPDLNFRGGVLGDNNQGFSRHGGLPPNQMD